MNIDIDIEMNSIMKHYSECYTSIIFVKQTFSQTSGNSIHQMQSISQDLLAVQSLLGFMLELRE